MTGIWTPGAGGAPVYHLFRLGVPDSLRDEFLRVGAANFTRSVHPEGGGARTRAMILGHEADSPSVHWVFEAYDGPGAYEEHVASEQYKEFAEAVRGRLDSRLSVELVPAFGAHKGMGEGAGRLHLARVDVEASRGSRFEAEVVANMRASMGEPGVVGFFAATEPAVAAKGGAPGGAAPIRWWFVELYADLGAYEAHRGTAHFQRYIDETGGDVVSKDVRRLERDLVALRD